MGEAEAEMHIAGRPLRESVVKRAWWHAIERFHALGGWLLEVFVGVAATQDPVWRLPMLFVTDDWVDNHEPLARAIGAALWLLAIPSALFVGYWLLVPWAQRKEARDAYQSLGAWKVSRRRESLDIVAELLDDGYDHYYAYSKDVADSGSISSGRWATFNDWYKKTTHELERLYGRPLSVQFRACAELPVTTDDWDLKRSYAFKHVEWLQRFVRTEHLRLSVARNPATPTP